MIKLFLILISLFNLNNTSKGEPVRLEKKENYSKFDEVCRKLCPYLLVACIVIISVLLFIVLVKYGASLTGTEANQYYNGNWR